MAKHLNIAALRAKAAHDAPSVTAPDGRKFAVGALSLDAYLGILELEERFETLRTTEKEQAAPDRTAQRALFTALTDMVVTLLPGFPAGQLQMAELFEVLAFVQAANTPEDVKATPDGATVTEGASDATAGEPTGPSSLGGS